MKYTIALKIDVTKIDKARLYKGEKGTYLDAVLMFDTEQDRFENNGMIVQSVSRDERLSGVRGEILGNSKLLSTSTEIRTTKEQPKSNHNDDDLPF